MNNNKNFRIPNPNAWGAAPRFGAQPRIRLWPARLSKASMAGGQGTHTAFPLRRRVTRGGSPLYRWWAHPLQARPQSSDGDGTAGDAMLGLAFLAELGRCMCTSICIWSNCASPPCHPPATDCHRRHCWRRPRHCCWRQRHPRLHCCWRRRLHCCWRQRHPRLHCCWRQRRPRYPWPCAP